MNAARSWGYRHPNACTGVRIAAGTWNLIPRRRPAFSRLPVGIGAVRCIGADLLGRLHARSWEDRIPARRAELTCGGSCSVPVLTAGAGPRAVPHPVCAFPGHPGRPHTSCGRPVHLGAIDDRRRCSFVTDCPGRP